LQKFLSASKFRTESIMGRPQQYLLATCNEQRFGLPLSKVERVVRMVEITPFPDAPRGVLGVINVQGRVVPVVSLWRGAEECGGDRLNHLLIIARTPRQLMGIEAERVLGIVECGPEDVIAGAEILPIPELVPDVLKLVDGLVLLRDPDVSLPADIPGVFHSAKPGADLGHG
jgi:purine-binding chemotaxis protein CheW